MVDAEGGAAVTVRVLVVGSGAREHPLGSIPESVERDVCEAAVGRRRIGRVDEVADPEAAIPVEQDS